jgi:MFS family permease
LSSGLGATAKVAILLSLCGGDAGRYAAVGGLMRSAVAVPLCVLGAVTGALSDNFGRRLPRLLDAVGRAGFNAAMLSIGSVRQYVLSFVLLIGVCGAGATAVADAALDDIFDEPSALTLSIPTVYCRGGRTPNN